MWTKVWYLMGTIESTLIIIINKIQAHPLPPPPAAADVYGQYYPVPEYNGESSNHQQFHDHPPPFCTGDYDGYGSGWQQPQNQWTQSDGFSFGAADNDSLGGGMMLQPPQYAAGPDLTGFGNFHHFGDY
ncbi:unnamed protein product [Cuscuta europaea]|uniref:Uncharacterized protein n=1 Tax=Cuscuta europaea TaxID=41803 RepID=A0A9P1E0W1_CUSEU|nr:unnamed protein product [Cuscuta europaea]